MKTKQTSIAFPSINLIAVTAALINQQTLTGDDGLDSSIHATMAAMPPLLKTVVVKTQRNEKTLQIKCPVTKEIMREAGDEDTVASFATSKACLAEWDDVELDCAQMVDPQLGNPWQEFLSSYPSYDDYEDMIRKFVILNYKFFTGRKLILAITETEDGSYGCGGSHGFNTYSLLDTDPGSRQPIQDDSCPAAEILHSAAAFKKRLRNYIVSGKNMEKSQKNALNLHQKEIALNIESILIKKATRTKKVA